MKQSALLRMPPRSVLPGMPWLTSVQAYQATTAEAFVAPALQRPNVRGIRTTQPSGASTRPAPLSTAQPPVTVCASCTAPPAWPAASIASRPGPPLPGIQSALRARAATARATPPPQLLLHAYRPLNRFAQCRSRAALHTPARGFKAVSLQTILYNSILQFIYCKTGQLCRHCGTPFSSHEEQSVPLLQSHANYITIFMEGYRLGQPLCLIPNSIHTTYIPA